jgi:branched-chain amino acid aminotransferase
MFQIPYSELDEFSEVIAAGTAAALVPIKSITSVSHNKTQSYIEDDNPGPIVMKLLSTLKGVQSGKVKDQWGWLDRVAKPDNYFKRNDTRNGVHEESIDELP